MMIDKNSGKEIRRSSWQIRKTLDYQPDELGVIINRWKRNTGFAF